MTTEERATALVVEHLSVDFVTTERTVHAVRDLSFDIGRGETVAIVGESGSGKSVTALALMRLIEHGGGHIVSGALNFARPTGDVIDLAKVGADTMRSIRGAEIAMIFQEPMTSLNPVLTVGDQIAEVHTAASEDGPRAPHLPNRCACSTRCAFRNRANVLSRYPHQLSGGMRQRVMIAMALSAGRRS